MNFARRLAAIDRDIARVETEIIRIAKLREAQEPTAMAFPLQFEDHLNSQREKLVELKREREKVREMAASAAKK
jgi:hypothetical protein